VSLFKKIYMYIFKNYFILKLLIHINIYVVLCYPSVNEKCETSKWSKLLSLQRAMIMVRDALHTTSQNLRKAKS